MKNEPLERLNNSLETVVTTQDIMNKFGCGEKKALKIMDNKSLHSYFIGNRKVCERQDFDNFINDMRLYGGTVSMTLGTVNSVINSTSPKININMKHPNFLFIAEVLSREELVKFIYEFE